MPWVAVCRRDHSPVGPDLDKTYKNVVASIREIQVTAGTFVVTNPDHPWADPAFHEFIVNLTDLQAFAIRDGVNPLFHDGLQSQPRWQQKTGTSADAYVPGSFADPEDELSVFAPGVPLPDEREFVELYDGNPAAGIHIATLDLDEGDGPQSRYVIGLKLFNPDGTPSVSDDKDQKVSVAGKSLILDYTNGETDFGIDTSLAGTIRFPSNHTHRVRGPAGEKTVTFHIWGRTLHVTPD